MGNCLSFHSPKEEDQLAASREIEQELKQARRDQERKIKLLLLGTGDSGKSTFAKQLRVLHKAFSKSEYEKHRSILRANCLQSMQIVLRDCLQRGLTFKGPLASRLNVVLEAAELDRVIAADVSAFWKSSVVIAAVEERENALQLPSSITYFFNHAMRFGEPDYLPTDDDVVRARLRTTGITEINFTFEDVDFTVVDVGGQRSERRKWLHCFDSVTAVIYLAALDEYDRTLEEAAKMNRLEESLQLFADLTGSQWFSNVPFILFLNKSDILFEKLKKKNLHQFFPEIPEPKGADYETAIAFIRDKFEDKFNGHRLYPYVTCAVDTENCSRVFQTVQDNVITTVVRAVGL